MHDVRVLIRSLGITSKYKGYRFIVEAVLLMLENPESGYKITKDIYPGIAKKYHTNISNIEHNIRTVVDTCWTKRREQLEKVAGYSLKHKPSNLEFLDILVFYIREHSSEM